MCSPRVGARWRTVPGVAEFERVLTGPGEEEPAHERYWAELLATGPVPATEPAARARLIARALHRLQPAAGGARPGAALVGFTDGPLRIETAEPRHRRELALVVMAVPTTGAEEPSGGVRP